MVASMCTLEESHKPSLAIMSANSHGSTPHYQVCLPEDMVRNIFTESAPSVAVLVPPLSSTAAVLKALTPLPQKSDGVEAEVGDCRQSHTLRFGKCV